MRLFCNNYQKLCQENADEIANLSGEAWVELRGMMEYISSFHVSLFEVEIIKKDLIGIAREADIEGVRLQDKIGIYGKEFCDSLLTGALKANKAERIWMIIKESILLLFLFYSLNFFLQGAPVNYGLGKGTVMIVIALIVRGVAVHYIAARTTYMKDKNRKIFRGSAYIVVTLVYAAATWLDFGDHFFLLANGWGLWGILLCLSVIAFLGSNYYWDKCSENYNWK